MCVADFAALDELCAWMRSNGATSARMGDVALTLGPPIVPFGVQQPGALPPDDSETDPERYELEALLASSGADVDVVMSAIKAARARVP